MGKARKNLKDGLLHSLGLYGPDEIAGAADCLEKVKSSDVETVRVLFADQHGLLRGKTVVASALPGIFMNGLKVPNTLLLKDTSHRTVFRIWEKDEAGLSGGAGDAILVPDSTTYRSLPWNDTSAWIFCTPVNKDGDEIPFAPRSVLRTAMEKLAAAEKSLVVGLEVEFQVFAVEDDRLDHASATMPAAPVVTRNLTRGYQFLTEQVYDQVEPLLDEYRQHAQALGLSVRSMEIEMGPSQFEFTFDPGDPMESADGMMMFRAMVKEVSARKGLHATFMCRPNLPNAAASGWHIHQSLCDKNGANLMVPEADDVISADASAWIAGLLEHAEESCLLTTPTVNGYKRYQPHQLAPDRILWGRDNRGAMIRGLMCPDDPASRIENRGAESAANPYYVLASQILSGLGGLNRSLEAPLAVETPYLADATRLPDNLLSAIQHFEASGLYRDELGDAFVDYLVRIRRAEWDRYHLAVSQWEQDEYFNLF